MANIVLYITWKLSTVMRNRYPKGFKRPWEADNVSMEDAVFHFNFYNGIGLFLDCAVAIGAVFSKWALLGLAIHFALIVQAIHREFISDGHWSRIQIGTESATDLIDFKCDLITRFAGMSVPLVMAIVILAVLL